MLNQFFLAVLDYGDIIYRHAAATTLKPLDSVYHSALRFITGDHYDTHHCIVYSKVGWSSLADRCNKHWYRFIFKALTGKQPYYIIYLKTPRVASELGKTAFSVSAPNSWNVLQLSLKLETLPSLSVFKGMLSNHCVSICNCFGWWCSICYNHIFTLFLFYSTFCVVLLYSIFMLFVSSASL